MPGSPILAAHIAEIQRKQKAKEEAAKKANAKTATQKASSAGVTAIIDKGIKEQGGGRGSTLSSIKRPGGILNQGQNSLTGASNVLARRIAERKAVEQRNQGRYSVTHNDSALPDNYKPNGIMQQKNKAQVEAYGTAQDFIDNPALMGKSYIHGLTKGTANAFIEGSHYLDSLYRNSGGDENASGNIHKTVIAANKKSNEENNVGNPLDNFQQKYQKETADILQKAEDKGLGKMSSFMMGLGQSTATLPAFAIPGLGEAAVMFQTAGQRYDEAVSEGASEKDALLSATLVAIPTAIIERFGGGEKIASLLLKGITPKKILSSIATSAITEGLEESAQQVISSGTKSVYKDVPVFSTEEGKDAWINPGMIKDSFVAGALAGGILGGATTAVSVGLNKAVSKSSTEPLDSIEAETRAKLDSGEITQQQADEVLKNVSTAKAVYEVSQAPTKEEAQARIDGFVSDGTLDEDQGRYVWQILTAEAKKNDEELPTSTEEQTVPEYKVGDVIQFDGDNAKVINIVEEDDGKKYFVDIDGQQDVITEDELVAEQQKTVSDSAIQQGSEEIPTQNKIDETDIDTAWNDLKEQYGTWKNGQAPQQINNMQVVSQFVDNALANVENPVIRQALIERVLAGRLTHEAYTDEQVQRDLNVDRTIFGEEAVNAQMRNDAEAVKNINTKKLVTAAIQELVDAVNNGDSSSALYLAQLMADVGTKFGQGSQAFSQLKKLTPAGRVLYAQQQLNADYKKKYGYAPEAIKADIETNTKEEIPNILSESVGATHGKDTANMVRQALDDGSLDLSTKIKRGDLKDISLELTRFISDKQSLSENDVIDVYGSIWEEVNRRVIAHRKSVIENMIAKTGKNKRKDYLNTLLEYNNIGAFDDPDVAATVLDKMKLPFLTKEDFNFITETAEKASKLPTDSREQLAEYSKIDKLLNEKKKHTVLQKIRTIQITGMLLSPRTMERNVVPNIAMSAPNAIGDIFGTVLDKQIAKKTGQRTMGNAANPANTLRDMKSGAVNAYKDIKEGVDTSLAGNRDNVPIGDVFSNGNLAGRTMNRASRVVTFGLQFGDRPFEEAYYNNSLRRQMEANGVTEPTQIMKDIAYTTATQRTWKDENRITRGLEAFQKWANAGNDFGFGSILMPFVKTPANLLKALYDYSPAAFASVVYDYRKLNKADPGTDEQVMAQFNLVNHLSKAVGGTIIMATAFALAKAGLIEITGAGDDNQDKEKYKEEVLGWQPYSFKIGDKYYSYAWVQPFASFFGSGADIYANLKKPENQGDNTIDTIINALGEAFTMSGKMIYEQTVLQGVSKLFSQDDPWNGFLEILVSAPQQFVPAMIGQLAATIDPYKRQTYTPPENLGGFVNNAVAGVVNRIPFASMTLPAKTNAMGEKMERFPGGVGSNFLNSFFNPAQVSQEKSNAVTDEIDRLEKATNEKLYPNSADNTVEVGTKTITLTGKEKQAWNKSVGGDFKAAVKELMNSDFYAEMTDDQKAKAISKIHEDINAIYKNEFLNKKDAGIPLESEYQKIKDAKDKYNISTAEFVAVKSGLNQISDDDGEYDAARKRDFVLNFCEGKGYSDEATVYMMDNLVFQNSTSVKNQADSLLLNANIPILDTYKAYSFYEKTISTTDNRTAISGLSTFIAEQAPNLTQEQRKLLGETIVNVIDPYGYFEQIVVKMSGDPEKDSTTALSKTMKKLLGQAADLGLTKDEFIYAYSYFKKVDNNASPESFARQIDKLNISADAKSLLTKARWVDVGDYAFRDGGEIEIKGYKLGTDIDLSERIDGRTKGGNTMAEYVPPSARESGVPDIVYKKPSNGKDMTVIAGEYKVTEEKIEGVKTGERAVFETEAGSAVVSPLGGKIVSVKRNSYIGGITVTVKYSDGTFGTYDGLADVSVKADDKVKPGQRIGSSSESVTFLYKDKTGTIKTPSTVFNIVDGSGSIESTSDYFPTKTAEIHDNFKAFSSGWGGYGSWGYGGYGGGGGSLLYSLIGKNHSPYSRYGFGGYPTYSYTGNENKKS